MTILLLHYFSSTTVSSPTSLSYSSSSPSENNSAISSPILTSPNRSSPEITNGNNNVTPENASENLGEVHLLSLSSLQNYSSISRDGSVQLQIVTQPEQQHRARYQTEGSRGAVKDKSGNGFPVVKLNGYNKPAVLQACQKFCLISHYFFFHSHHAKNFYFIF